MAYLLLDAKSEDQLDISSAGLSPYFQEVVNQWQAINSNQTHFEFRSSGSTGIPKVVVLTRSQLEASASKTAGFFRLSEKSLLVCCLNVSYIAGFMMLFRAHCLGARVLVFEPSTSLDVVLQTLKGKEQQADFISLVPAQIDWLLQQQTLDFSSVFRTILVGGAGLTSFQEETLAKQHTDSWMGYGMTETCSHIALRHIGYKVDFELLSGVSLKLDQRGCLAISADVTNGQWIQTNDIVSINGSVLTYHGRYDRVINTGGLKVNAEWLEQELESALKITGVNRYHITAIPSEKWGQKIVLLYEGVDVIDPTKVLSESKIQSWQQPKHWFKVDQLPVTQTGKIDLVAAKQLATQLVA